MSTVDPLSAAVERLRAIREAAQAHQAAAMIAEGVWAQPQRFGVWLSTASSEALEQLLEAVSEHDQADDPHEWETCFIAVRHAADALASHLTEGSGTP